MGTGTDYPGRVEVGYASLDAASIAALRGERLLGLEAARGVAEHPASRVAIVAPVQG